MGSLGTALVLLGQLWALQGAPGLSVLQEPRWLRVRQDTQVTLTCEVVQTQAWERLRVEWIKDGDSVCQSYVTKGSLRPGGCGPRRRLSWRPPGTVTLQLDRVSLNDSGDYVCWVATEIPELEEAEGNGTWLLVETDGRPPPKQGSSFPGLLPALLVAGGVAVAAIALGAGIWGRRRCGHEDSGNPLYSNVLYRPRGAPKKTEAWPVEGKVLETPREDRKTQSFYSVSFPQPPTPQRCLAPKPCPSPRPSHLISTVRVSPDPGPSRQPRPRGFLEEGREVGAPGDPERTPKWPREDATGSTGVSGARAPS
ncbi:transmembrane and immunoglobulin domain-containing protein 2 [Diceros bicornis minor]|uniref:transmembrane and immunoglobulin domain-containing protein 2 n=1 Tax=Diceros bicornis minor TaxID=77932 RepID=UPI0026EF52C9|nr:transmembrane and immunoglobulin domain-containing protein 2 [Diceros bicornis minor]